MFELYEPWIFKITDEDIENITRTIHSAIRYEFLFVHLSKNLRKTMRIRFVKNDQGKKIGRIHISAPKYDMKKFRAEKVIVRKPNGGSYAQLINKNGGISKKHRHYIENNIILGVREWAATQNNLVEITLEKGETSKK